MKGKCNCGEVSFELHDAVSAIYKCYCTLCQRQSGTASNAATIIKKYAFQWLSGVESISIWKKETGFNSHFCSTCGCPVPNPIGDGFIWVPMGLLEPTDIPTVVHLFSNTRPTWDISESCDELIEGVDSVEKLYKILETRRGT